MKLITYLLIPILFFLVSCDLFDEVEPKKEEKKDKVEVGNGWEAGFPQVVSGTTTIDIKVNTERQATVYYIVTNEALPSATPELIKNNAISSDESTIIKSGLLKISESEVHDTLTKTLESFQAGNTYYTYVALEVNDTLAPSINEFTSELALRQTKGSFYSEEEDRAVNYLAYKLEDYYKNPDKSYPLLVFLAGSGSTSSGKLNLLQNNTLPMFIEQGNEYPFIIVSPQPIHSRWDSVLVDEMVEEAKQKFRVDEDRIYITGISGGGYGAWRYAFSYPDKVAAIVPISGGGVPELVCSMNEVPVWAFHGEEDTIVPVAEAKAMINALKKCTPPPSVEPKLTIYPGVGHEAWERTYDKSAGYDIFNWLLNHKKE